MAKKQLNLKNDRKSRQNREKTIRIMKIVGKTVKCKKKNDEKGLIL